MDYYIYLYWRLDTNEPFYVGKGHNDRWKWLYRKNKHFNNIINKHPIAVEIVKDNLTEEQAFYWEEEIIRQLVFEYGFSINIKGNYSTDHYCHLVNQTWGGEGTSGLTLTEEHKRKLSEANKGKNPWENMTEEQKEETKRKMSEAQKGENHHMYGKHLTEEHKRKLSKAHKGKHLTEETKRKMSEAKKGKHPTEETKRKMSENNGMKGKHHTEETKRKIGETRKSKCCGKNNPNAKSVITIINDKIFGVFDCAKQGAEYFNCANSNIVNCCKGKLKSCGKYNGQKLVWKYITIIEL